MRKLVLVICALLLFPLAVGAKKRKRIKRASVIDLVTNRGTITIKLFRKKAPRTTRNFLKYVRSGFYNGTIFHRVIKNFMIQGGGMTFNMAEKPTRKPIRNEANNGLSNKRGTLAMARTGQPHSASAQFFINLRDNGFLDHRSKTTRGWGYCVFGKVIKGMKIVDAIAKTPTTDRKGHQNVPVMPIKLTKVVVVK